MKNSGLYLAALILTLNVIGAADSALQKLHQTGFELFNGYENSDAQRIRGWEMLVQAARSGEIGAKKHVAAFAAGFISLNADPERKYSFKPDLRLALEFYRELVARGDTEAMTHLALLYSSGIGEPANESEAPRALLHKAAAKGNKKAMTLLAERYLYGFAETRDVLEAARWELLSATEANPNSRWIDERGEPRIQDSPEKDEMARVVSLFHKAYKQRDRNALEKLKELHTKASKPLPRA